MDPECKSLQNLESTPDLDWVNGKERSYFCCEKAAFFKYFELHLDLDFTFEKYFRLWLDLDWVFENYHWGCIAKYGIPLISVIKAGPSRCGAQCKTWARGPSKQWFYGVIVFSHRGTIVVELSAADIQQRWLESLFQTPTPLLFQNFWILDRIWVWQLFIFENPTPIQTRATIIDLTVIYPWFYLRKKHTDSCYCLNWKVTPVQVRFFLKFWLRVRIRVRKKTQNPTGVDFGYPDPIPPMIYRAALTRELSTFANVRD